MQTMMINAYKKIGDNNNPSSQTFYRIDEEHAVGSQDFCVYQIVSHDDLLDSNNNFTGDFNCPIIYVNSEYDSEDDESCNIIFNYAEDNNLASYLADIIKETLSENGKLDNADNFDDESLFNIIKSINENKEDCEILDEFMFILDDAISKL